MDPGIDLVMTLSTTVAETKNRSESTCRLWYPFVGGTWKWRPKSQTVKYRHPDAVRYRHLEANSRPRSAIGRPLMWKFSFRPASFRRQITSLRRRTPIKRVAARLKAS